MRRNETVVSRPPAQSEGADRLFGLGVEILSAQKFRSTINSGLRGKLVGERGGAERRPCR